MMIGRRSALSVVLVLAGASSAFAGPFTNSLQERLDEKDAARLANSTYDGGFVSGETVANAIPIPSLPFRRTGNTCGYEDDYYEACPYFGEGAGDVVFKYTPPTNERITIDLCLSDYDTKVFVYENAYVPNALPYACNDDANPPCTEIFRSYLECVHLTAGNTYYIVVDGYGDECGDYDLSIRESVDCPVACDPACGPGITPIQEGEPVCFNGYVDTFDGGCNSTPPTFKTLPCANLIKVCGTAGDYAGYRDTDWYQVIVPASTTITATLCASFNSQIAILNGNTGCHPITPLCGSAFGEPGVTVRCQVPVGAGKVWIFVADSDFVGWPCGSPYTLTIQGACAPTSTESTTWGNVKRLYVSP